MQILSKHQLQMQILSKHQLQMQILHVQMYSNTTFQILLKYFFV